ncbi:MAG TPA: ABC transporter ATP-binding protein [Anaerolineales bacterium]|jgi:peptide/nickel transport system ATP-binding protein|nr:oligopeptide ABC transporter ATP-binding protein [Anaerolineae bacterium]HRJ55668.1 ABC transporter ATP-binding protein [Anaerolineales bacterium]HRK90915.1 ABC transporter ATP-binding protein [Anaerolineales bacterium]
MTDKQRDVLLSIQDLHVWFELRRFGFGHAGYVKAVDGVTFDLHFGETIAIVGESGCGKTSLMRTILGLNKPTKGKVVFEDLDVGALRGEALRQYRAKIGYVQQDPFGALAPFMNVQQILEEPLRINGVKDAQERERRVRKVMEEVKLTPVDDFLHKYPHMLSGGQQQRVVIARAIILEPQLVVADEPVSMLDASVRVEILKLLRGLQEKYHMAVIYITHDLSTVRYFSERVFVMYAGNVVEKAPVNSIVHNPKHPYTAALMDATSDPDANNALTFRELPPGEPPSLVNPPPGCRFHPRCPKRIENLCEVEEPYDLPADDHLVACWLYK